MLYNKEIRLLALYCLTVSAVGVGAAFAAPAAAGWAALGMAAALGAGYAVFTAWRYRQLKRLADYLARVYRGRRALDLRDNTEGELSILKNDLYKITVTLQEQADRLEADRTLLAEALGDISHQLKTPLTAALMMTDLLDDPALPPPRRQEFLQSLTAQLTRMQWLVTTLLKLSLLDADAVAMQRAPVDLAALLEKAAAPLRPAMEARGIAWRCACPDGARWQGDENWTMQAVQNVLKNCVEQMPYGGTLSVRAAETPLALTLTVEDTGGGIDPADLPHLFERFYTGRKAGAGGGESAGIGLALARSILQKQGGTIRAKTRRRGFTIELPKCTV